MAHSSPTNLPNDDHKAAIGTIIKQQLLEALLVCVPRLR
jgi:hypothetical protein